MLPDVNNELAQLYRDVFSTQKGEIVLFHMLQELGFHEAIVTDEERVMKNYAMRLLQIVGGNRLEQTTVMIFLKQLMRQPLPKEGKNETRND